MVRWWRRSLLGAVPSRLIRRSAILGPLWGRLLAILRTLRVLLLALAILRLLGLWLVASAVLRTAVLVVLLLFLLGLLRRG